MSELSVVLDVFDLYVELKLSDPEDQRGLQAYWMIHGMLTPDERMRLSVSSDEPAAFRIISKEVRNSLAERLPKV